MPTRYRIDESLPQACSFLKLDVQRVLRRAGLPEDWLQQDKTDIDGETMFRLFAAICDEAGREDVIFDLANGYAHGPFLPPVLAFSTAETVYSGWQRLAVFKPLLAPVQMSVSRDDAGATLELVSILDGVPIPSVMEAFEMAYLMECIRTYTGRDVTPQAIELQQQPTALAQLEAYFQIPAKTTGQTRLVLSPEDADLPLISRSATLWETLEPGLTKQLQEHQLTATMSMRVRRVLTDSLPGGCTTAEEMARRLGVSKRSLQRRLTEEGTTFQALLNDVRADMSERYLKQSNLSVPEISHLLGFQDTSSFFRAFQGWTGKTPGNFRAEAGQRLH